MLLLSYSIHMTVLSYDNSVTLTAMPKKTFYNIDNEKQKRIILAAELEFAEYGYDLASIQRILQSAKIPRGSFYQYFEDKEDLYITVLTILKNHKLQYLSPATENWQKMNFFSFLRMLTKLGFDFARSYPHYVKIAEHLVTCKTLSYEKVRVALLNNSSQNPQIGSYEFYLMVVQEAIKKGEIKSGIPEDAVALFIQFLLENLGRLVLSGTYGGVLSDEAESIYNTFISILEKGIVSTNKQGSP